MSDERDSRNGGPKGGLTKELGLRIVRIRKRRGWSQAQLAARLGVPRERLGKWERGLNAPSLDHLSALSKVLEVPLEELGLGRGAKVPISAVELKELTRYILAMERMLKPWMGHGKE
jgi:transcriptional regulator with XRE-family HTH domain